MSFYREVTTLQPGSDELQDVRKRALEGETYALKVFAYYSVNRQLQKRKELSAKSRVKILRTMISEDLVAVNFG